MDHTAELNVNDYYLSEHLALNKMFHTKVCIFKRMQYRNGLFLYDHSEISSLYSA